MYESKIEVEKFHYGLPVYSHERRRYQYRNADGVPIYPEVFLSEQELSRRKQNAKKAAAKRDRQKQIAKQSKKRNRKH